MESPRLRRMIREHSSSSITIKPRSRHVSECEPLKINVIKSSKYVGPPEIPNCYPLFSSPRGHVLIINNERFNEKTSDGSNYRKGSEVDGNNLETLRSTNTLKNISKIRNQTIIFQPVTGCYRAFCATPNVEPILVRKPSLIDVGVRFGYHM